MIYITAHDIKLLEGKMKIKGYLHGGNHRGGYVYFDVLDKVPKIGDEYQNETVVKVFEASLDPEQDGDEIYSYDCYKIITDYVDYDGNHDETERYVAVEHEYEDELDE
jgi:hypothetical protein